MYWWMSIDALIRIAFAMTFLFVIVPALAWPRRPGATLLEWLFWNLGAGITLITLLGQVLSLANLVSMVTLLLAAGAVILIGRSIHSGVSPWSLFRRSAETSFLAFLNIMDRRVNVPRRMRRAYRRTIAALHEKTRSPKARWQIAGWVALTIIAAAFRLYRPFASANLGFPDSYVHLYMVKLLEEGRQVDPAFGPYPHGMHFVLMAIHDLTNVDLILLMNFFGAFVGVLMTLAVADTARRLSGSVAAGLVSGFLFATIVGGPTQFFLLGRLDILLYGFQRQSSALPQELALALLFPAVMFLLDYLQNRDRWHLAGFIGCTAAIAAVHTAVILPLGIMSAVAVLATAIHRSVAAKTVRQVIVAGAAATVVGSAWAVAFIAYPYFGGKNETAGGFSARKIATFYTPFVESLLPGGAGQASTLRTPLTPFLIACIVVSIALIVASFAGRSDLRVNRLWIATVFLLFVLIHFAPMIGLPQPLEIRRNSQWMMMAMTIVIAMALTRFLTARYGAAVVALLLIGWTTRVPRLDDPAIYSQIVNSSGYGASTLAVLKIQQSFEPYTWTLVSYGQEFPMVLRRGFHMPAAQFLDRYDPAVAVIPIPTPDIFIIVEKKPHQFQIDNWTRQFSRSDLEQRLQTWVYVYQTTHNNLHVFLEDEDVRVYQITRTLTEVERISQRPGA